MEWRDAAVSRRTRHIICADQLGYAPDDEWHQRAVARQHQRGVLPSGWKLARLHFDKFTLDSPIFRAAKEVTLLQGFVVIAAYNRAALVRGEDRVANFPLREAVE